ncbi:MAG: hypothetical protein WCR76_02090 [Sphaerochaetaceae bacterium]
MKRTIKVFLVSAVFFVVLMLAGCGIPSSFLSLSNYIFKAGTQGNTEKEKTVEIAELSGIDSDEDLSSVTGPSVMFFYTIGTKEDIESLYSKRSAETAFAAKYVANGYQGIPIQKTEVLSFDSNTRKLYSFNTSNSESTFVFSAPRYVLSTDAYSNTLKSAVLTYDPTNLYFTLTWDATNTGYSLYIKNIKQSNSQIILYRYNNTVFLKNSSVKDDDYSSVTSGSPPWICIYAAFCLSYNENTSFKNNYWSPLLCLGYINLNQST